MKSLFHLKAATTAAHFGDWLSARRHLRNEPNQICPSAILRDNSLAVGICTMANQCGAGVRAELMRIFRTPIFCPSEADFGTTLNFFVYEIAFENASDAVEKERWSALAGLLQLVASLPSPSEKRESEITHLLSRFIQATNAAQTAMMEQFPLMSHPLAPVGHIWDTTRSAELPFRHLNDILAALTAQINYSDLGRNYASLLLTHADWPILAHLTSETLATMWEVSELAPTIFSDAARQWARRLTLLGPEPFAAGETE